MTHPIAEQYKLAVTEPVLTTLNPISYVADMMEATGLAGTGVCCIAWQKERDDWIGPYAWTEEQVASELRDVAKAAAGLLIHLDVEDPATAFVAEYERAAIKHPGMTLDADGPTDESRFYALAEEVGEVAASLTYDNAQGAGHGADTIAEVTQVGALALAWLTRYQDGENR